MHLVWLIPVSLLELFNLYLNSNDHMKGRCVGLRSSSAFLALSSKVVIFGLLLIFFRIKRHHDLK